MHGKVFRHKTTKAILLKKACSASFFLPQIDFILALSRLYH